MYQLQVITPSAGSPVTAAELRAHLRLNDTSEDTQLADWLAAATALFEIRTCRPVLSTTYRQHAYQFVGPLYLMRGGVSAISSVHFYDTSDTLQLLDPTDYQTDITGTPAAVWCPSGGYPVTSYNKRPVAYCDFVAGWANASTTPPLVKTGIKLLASHWYMQHEAFSADTLKSIPAGFDDIVNSYKTGLIADPAGTYQPYVGSFPFPWGWYGC
jgi:uncharacterized phiE125 gp8 family phage protein